MATNPDLAREITKLTAEHADPVTADEVERVEKFLQSKVSADDLECLNVHLRKTHRATMTLTDLACMLVLHAKSVRENDNASPHKRFIKWSQSKRNEWAIKWDSVHIKVGLIAFEAAKLTIKIAEPARKQATKYKLHKDVISLVLDFHTQEQSRKDDKR